MWLNLTTQNKRLAGVVNLHIITVNKQIAGGMRGVCGGYAGSVRVVTPHTPYTLLPQHSRNIPRHRVERGLNNATTDQRNAKITIRKC